MRMHICRTSQKPPHGNVLYLNGTGSGLVNNACFPSAVAPSYAPSGQVSAACATASLLHAAKPIGAAAQCKQHLARDASMSQTHVSAAAQLAWVAYCTTYICFF